MGRLKKCQKKAPITITKGKQEKELPVEDVSDMHSVDDLIKEAKEASDDSDYKHSYELLKEALKKEPDNAEALHHLGSALLELNDPDEARKVLRCACDIEPRGDHEKWLIRAELEERRDALECYRVAGGLVEEKLKDAADGDEEDVASLKRVLSRVHVCIAELFMSELCDEAEAQEEVAKNVEKAIEIDPRNPEALQASGHFNFVIGNDDLAEKMLKDSTDLWLPDVIREREGGAVADWKNVPDFNARMETAKLCVELRMYPLAHKILLCLLGEDETNPDVLYLYGLVLYLKGQKHYPSAKSAFRFAKAAATDIGWTDEGTLEHIEELLEELKDVDTDAEESGSDDEDGSDGSESDAEEMDED